MLCYGQFNYTKVKSTTRCKIPFAGEQRVRRHDRGPIFQRDEVVFAVVLLQEEHDVGEDDDDDVDGAVVPRLQLQHADTLEHELAVGLQHVRLLEFFAVIEDGGLGVDRFVDVQEALLALLLRHLRVDIFENFLKYKTARSQKDFFYGIFQLGLFLPFKSYSIVIYQALGIK